MNLNEDKVKLLANSLRIGISDQEASLQSKKLNEILDYVQLLDEIKDLEKKELIYVHENINIFRKDEPGGSLSNEIALKNAPEEVQGMFRVPKIV